MIEQIKARITDIEAHLASLVNQHTAVSGNLAEAKHFLSMAEEAAKVGESVVDAAEEIVEAVVGVE